MNFWCKLPKDSNIVETFEVKQQKECIDYRMVHFLCYRIFDMELISLLFARQETIFVIVEVLDRASIFNSAI